MSCTTRTYTILHVTLLKYSSIDKDSIFKVRLLFMLVAIFTTMILLNTDPKLLCDLPQPITADQQTALPIQSTCSCPLKIRHLFCKLCANCVGNAKDIRRCGWCGWHV